MTPHLGGHLGAPLLERRLHALRELGELLHEALLLGLGHALHALELGQDGLLLRQLTLDEAEVGVDVRCGGRCRCRCRCDVYTYI